MNKRPSFSLLNGRTWGARQIAIAYILVGGLWILFSDQLAAKIALSERMLTLISLYKGWGYVLVTALLLYLLIRHHTAALRASEEQLRRVIDAMPIFISYVDSDQQYRFTNQTYKEWYDDQAEGKHVEEVIGKAAYQIVSKYIDQALAGEVTSYEIEVPYRDTELFMTATYIPDIGADGQVKGFFVMAQDRTAQRQAEEEHRLWADAFEGCYHGIAIGDPHTNRIVVCNPAFANLHKSRVEDIVGSTILSLYTPADHEHVRRHIERADQIGHARFETHMVRRDGSTFPVQMDIVSVLGEDGELLYRVATVQDISERKQAEERVKESEAKYRTLVEHLPVITYISEADAYVGVSYISPQIESLGFDRDQWLAEPELWLRSIHPDDRERVSLELQKFEAGARVFRAEYRLMLPNGEARWFHDESIRVKDQEGNTILKQGFMLDITESKQAQEVLHESEERYRIVSELTSDYAYKDRVEADGRIVPEWITDSFTRITGYSLDETQEPDFWQRLVHPDHLQILLEHIQILLSGQSDTREFRILTKSGEVRWLRDYSNAVWDAEQKRVVGLYGAVQDVTERKGAEEKLLSQARQLAQVNDAVITADKNLMIRGWNPAAERLYGWKAEEVIGKKGEEVLRSEFYSKTRAQVIQELKETGEFSAEITQLRKDGSRIQIESRSVALRDEPGQVIGYVSVNRNITERKQAEEENKSLARFPEENPNPVLRATYEGKIVYANAASNPLLNHWAVKVGDDLPKDWITVIEEVAKTCSEKTIEAEYGETIYSFMIAYAPNAHDVNIYGRDITERKRAEKQLERTNQKLNEILVSIQDDLYVLDQDWNFVYASKIFTAKVGKEPEDLVGKNIWELFPKHVGTIFEENLHAAMEKGETRRFEIAGKYTGAWYRMTAFPSTEGITVLGTDITERKQAEEYLRRFELLSEHSRDIILFMRREDGRIIEANSAAIDAYGYSREELLTLTVRDLRASNTLGLTADQMAKADAGGILFETIHRRKDGSTFPVEVSSQGANIGGVRTLISIIRDITERKQAEEALRLKDQLLHLTSEMAKVGGWEFDSETGKGTWTDEVAKIHDIDPTQQTNVEIGLSFYLGESREKIEQAVKESIEFGKPYDLELEMVSAKGQHKWIRTIALPIVQNGKVVKVQGIFQDITERKQIEKDLQAAHDDLELKVQERTAALSEANALLKALMDNMPDHIYFKDLQSRFIRTSRSQATLLGLGDPAEAIGKTDFDFFPHAARSFAEEQEVMRSGKPLIDLEEWVVWPDRRETWVSTTKMPLRDAAGQTIGIFGISHDITDRKRAEQEIKQLNADLEKQAEKLKAANKELEAFSYSVSHDLRAPLRAIDGYTRILVEDYESILDAEGKRICSIISREARRMGQLIDDLLAFSRLGRKEIYTSKIDMRGMAVSVLNELLKEEERARLDFHIGKLPPVRGDSSLIRQVWFNLLANAIKFTSKKERALIEIGSHTNKEELIYYVRDSGAGFEMEYVNKLFGVFQRLHSESEFDGTGVGLAIVQRIIYRHEGRVWAEGEVGKGATFYFALPRKEDHHE